MSGIEPLTYTLRKCRSTNWATSAQCFILNTRYIILEQLVATRARSEVGLSRLPVTEEIAGSNPVGPAMKDRHQSGGGFFS